MDDLKVFEFEVWKKLNLRKERSSFSTKIIAATELPESTRMALARGDILLQNDVITLGDW